MNDILIAQEPLKLKDLSIDYENLDYLNAALEIHTTPANSDSTYIEFIQTSLTIVSEFLTVRKVELNKSNNPENLYWLQINTYNCSYQNPGAGNDHSHYQIELLSKSEGEIKIILRFNSYEDFLNFEFKVTSVCPIESPALQENYQYVRKIGQGTQACIDLYKSRDPSLDESYAVKTFLIKESMHKDKIMRLIENEIQYLRELNFCENVITLLKVYKTTDKIQLVMKLALHGTLREYIIKKRNISEVQIRYIMEQLLLTIDLFHSSNLIHRDIKPDNILLLDQNELNICIADLGFTCRIDDQEQIRFKCGTPGYVDPEVLKGLPFSKKSDIFSLGCLLYNLITGKLLINGRSTQQILVRNMNMNPSQIIDDTCQHVSAECRDLLKKMVEVSQVNRPSAEECLHHSWFSVNKQLLTDLLYLNKRAPYINSPLKRSVFEHDEISFIVGPNYFGNISEDNSDMEFLSCVNTPAVRGNRSSSPGVRIRYNHMTNKKEREPSSKAPKNSKEADNFSIFLHPQTPKHRFQKSTKVSKLINNFYGEQKGEIKVESLKMEQLEQEEGDSFTMFEFDEFQGNEDIGSKLNKRVQINDVINDDKLFHIKKNLKVIKSQ